MNLLECTDCLWYLFQASRNSHKCVAYNLHDEKRTHACYWLTEMDLPKWCSLFSREPILIWATVPRTELLFKALFRLDPWFYSAVPQQMHVTAHPLQHAWLRCFYNAENSNACSINVRRYLKLLLLVSHKRCLHSIKLVLACCSWGHNGILKLCR